MRIITTETKAFKFNELSEEAKEKAIQKEKDYERENGFTFLSDDMNEWLHEHLEEDKRVKEHECTCLYSLSYCQGDGAMFEGCLEFKGFRVDIKHSGHYYHYNSKEWSFEDSEEIDKLTPKAFDSLEKDFEEFYVDISKKLTSTGYLYIEDSLSDARIEENIEANEYEFTEDGKMI